MPPSERGEAWPGSGDVVVATAQGHLLLSPQYPVSGASSPRLAVWTQRKAWGFPTCAPSFPGLPGPASAESLKKCCPSVRGSCCL